MNTLTYTAAGTNNHVFIVSHKCEVALDVYGTFANSGTLTLTRSAKMDGTGTYHNIQPAPDPTAPLTGGDFTVTAGLMTALILPAGSYGVVIAAAGATSISLDVSGRWAHVAE